MWNIRGLNSLPDRKGIMTDGRDDAGGEPGEGGHSDDERRGDDPDRSDRSGASEREESDRRDVAGESTPEHSQKRDEKREDHVPVEEETDTGNQWGDRSEHHPEAHPSEERHSGGHPSEEHRSEAESRRTNPPPRGSTLSQAAILEYTTDRRSLSQLVQLHWGIRVTVGAVVLGLVVTWGLVALADVDPLYGGAVVGLLVLPGLVWVVLYYRLWVYQVREDAIYLERGVVTHVRTLVPYVRIQHVDTSRSPIERLLGLSTLVVYTAGSRGADVSIPGLLPEQARDLQRRVKELAIEAEGDDAL